MAGGGTQEAPTLTRELREGKSFFLGVWPLVDHPYYSGWSKWTHRAGEGGIGRAICLGDAGRVERRIWKVDRFIFHSVHVQDSK